jgi:hypothetical protein
MEIEKIKRARKDLSVGNENQQLRNLKHLKRKRFSEFE